MSPFRRAVVVSVFLLTALVIAGCGAASSPTSTQPTPQQIYDRAEHSAMKDAKVAMTGHFSSTEGSMVMTASVNATGELVLQPTYALHLAMTMDLTSEAISGTVTGDVIEVGGKRYTKTAFDLAGVPSSSSSKYVIEDVPVSESSLLPARETNLKLVGEETIRGDKCWHLSGTETTNAQGTPVASGTAGASTIHEESWVRERDYYYVRMKMDEFPGMALPMAASSASATPTPTSSGFQVDLSDYDRGVTVSPPPADQISGTHFKVGDHVTVGDLWMVTVNSVRTSSGGEFDQPQAGNTYLVLDVTFQNVSSEAQSLSTAMELTLKDEQGQGYNEAYVSFTKSSPGGTVEPGGLTRGEIAYEVPASAHHFTLLFEPGLFGSEVTLWDITI